MRATHCHNQHHYTIQQQLMSKRIVDKIRQASAKVRSSFFKPKPNQENSDSAQNSKQQQQTNKSDAQQLDSRWKSFATMAQQQIKNVNKAQLDYMKKKLSDFTPESSNILRSIKDQASGLKDSNLKESLKEGTNKLKDTSKQAMEALKSQAKRLQGAKEQLSDALKKINPRNKQQDTKQLEIKKERAQKEESKKEKTLKWFHRQMHNSQQNWKSLQEMIQRQLKTNATSRFNLIQRIFQKLYWKTVTLICLIVFFYAFGSNVPREIRKFYEKSQKNEVALPEKGQLREGEKKQL